MRSQICIPRIIVRVLMGTSLLVFLNGCGGHSDNKQSVTLSPTQVTVNPSPTSRGFDIAGLLHIDSTGITCQYGPAVGDGNLVLRDEHRTYDSSELQQIEAYVQALGSEHPPSIVPPTLQWIKGGPKCDSHLEITNISSTTIQLQAIDMKLVGTPQPNSTHYHLIEACSLLQASERLGCPGEFGGGPRYEYDYQFKSTAAVAVFHSKSPAGPAEEITLNPSDLVGIALSFTPVGTPHNFIYTVIPELVLGTETIELKQLEEVVTFAGEDQFSCSMLNGNTFLSVTPPFFMLPPSGRWCM